MAARLTDKQKKKILADYTQLGSYSAVAKLNGVSDKTVRNIVLKNPEISEKFEQKKEQNTADILEYMESTKERVCDIIEVGLRVLPEKIAGAKSASEVTTALGTLIDKWAMIGGGPKDEAEEDGLSRSLRELGEGLESDE